MHTHKSDLLLIMGLSHEYNVARTHVRALDYSLLTSKDACGGQKGPTVHLFETVIRYLGGLLSAYEYVTPSTGTFQVFRGASTDTLTTLVPQPIRRSSHARPSQRTWRLVVTSVQHGIGMASCWLPPRIVRISITFDEHE